MIRRPPRSTLDRSSAASDVYKRQVMARGGQVVFITDPDGERHAPAGARVVVTAPRCDPLIAPLVMAAPIQLLAYHVAVQKGADVDQPRNLAKSVTVE